MFLWLVRVSMPRPIQSRHNLASSHPPAKPNFDPPLYCPAFLEVAKLKSSIFNLETSRHSGKFSSVDNCDTPIFYGATRILPVVQVARLAGGLF